MAPRYTFGLIVGVIGLLLNTCVAVAFAFCGPFTGIIVGAVAGFLAANGEQQPAKAGNARVGATAGGIAGLFVMVGQLIGAMGSVAFYHLSGTPMPLHGMDMSNLSSSEVVVAYLGGLVTGVCFGLIGVLLSALAGAAAAYFAPTSSADPIHNAPTT